MSRRKKKSKLFVPQPQTLPWKHPRLGWFPKLSGTSLVLTHKEQQLMTQDLLWLLFGELNVEIHKIADFREWSEDAQHKKASELLWAIVIKLPEFRGNQYFQRDQFKSWFGDRLEWDNIDV